MRSTLARVLRPGSLAGHASFAAIAFAISRLLGLLREVAISARLGTSESYDAYVAAFRLPDLVFVIVMSGAFGSAFIPVFSGFLARGDEERALRLVNTLLSYTLMALAVVALLMLVLADPLMRYVVAPDLTDEGRRMAVNLTRLFLLSPLLLGIGAAAKGMLESRGMFPIAVVAPIVYNLGIIFGAVALVPVWGVYGLGIGVVLGAAGNAAVQMGYLLRQGYRFRPMFSAKVDGLDRVGRMLVGRISTQLVAHTNLIVTTNIASRVGEGAIASISIAQQLVMLPHGIVAMSVSTVIFPTLARQFEGQETDQFRHTLVRALSFLTFLSMPALIVLAALRTSVIQVVFQRGSFDADSTRLVAEVMGIFALSLVFRT